MNSPESIAYFSMEVGVDPKLPTYSGGLGVLAGDTLKSAADLELPVCGVTLLYRKGFFRQTLNAQGSQNEEDVTWEPEKLLSAEPKQVGLEIEGRKVAVKVWRYDCKGVTGHIVPIYFLDTDLKDNHADDRTLTNHLYGGDEDYRLRQEALLGLGGVEWLKQINRVPEAKSQPSGKYVFHMNEGHSALLTLALLQHRVAGDLKSIREEDYLWVKAQTVFTTHTPVPAGHDTFPIELSKKIIGEPFTKVLEELEVCPDGRLNMSLLAIKFSRFVNGVAKRHAEISRRMFPGTDIHPVTNGIHTASWTHPAMQSLFDTYCDGWRKDNNYLRSACEIPSAALETARAEAKRDLLSIVKERTGVELDENVFTIGFARRAAEYKRADLLFEDPDALAKLAAKFPIQLVFSGKAHPKDFGGKKLIENVFTAAQALGDRVKIVYVPNYDMVLGRAICSGVDIWLNNPVKPLEASGTSGMKAAVNGVPNFSTLDGWWVEGCIDGVTGWEIYDQADAFGKADDGGSFRQETASGMLSRLESEILPMYYNEKDAYTAVRRQSIFVNGTFFTTQRMVEQYYVNAYKS
jgi:starch phosphorylase